GDDAVAAEQSFRDVLRDHPTSTLADDAAAGLARLLVEQGRNREAADILADATARYARRARYVAAGRDRWLRFERLGRTAPARIAAVLRQRLARRGDVPGAVAFVLKSVLDRDASPDIRRMRRRLARPVDGRVARTVAASGVTDDARPVLASATTSS